MDFGFIAHELSEYYPSLVYGKRDDEQYQGVKYIGLISILVKEVQNLKKIVNGLINGTPSLIETGPTGFTGPTDMTGPTDIQFE